MRRAIDGWRPSDDAARALRWRLAHARRALDRARVNGETIDDPLLLLTLVVRPPRELRDRSLEAVRSKEREQVAA